MHWQTESNVFSFFPGPLSMCSLHCSQSDILKYKFDNGTLLPTFHTNPFHCFSITFTIKIQILAWYDLEGPERPGPTPLYKSSILKGILSVVWICHNTSYSRLLYLVLLLWLFPSHLSDFKHQSSRKPSLIGEFTLF